MIKAVQKVVLQEDDNGEIPANYGYTEGDLTESALKAVREGKVITTNERSYPSPTDGRKRRTSKAKAPVSNCYSSKTSYQLSIALL